MKIDRIKSLTKYFLSEYADAILKLDDSVFSQIEEIRFRLNSYPYIYTNSGSFILIKKETNKYDLNAIFLSLTEHSPHHFKNDISKGFFTSNGIRIGVSGSFSYVAGEYCLEELSGINLRIPCAHTHICQNLIPYISKNGFLLNTLIISKPQLGKTTLIRDIARACSLGDNIFSHKVTVIDERFEIYGNGCFDLGNQTDVLSGIKKTHAFSVALRCLSPRLIVTDELGDLNDAESLQDCANSGVNVLATAHSENLFSLKRRSVFAKIIQDKLFDRYVELSVSLGKITVFKIYDINFFEYLKEPIYLCGEV